MIKLTGLLLATLFSIQGFSQSDEAIESEFEQLESTVETQQGPVQVVRPVRKKSVYDEEMAIQEQILKRKQEETEVSSDPNVDRFPKPQPHFQKPPGPKQGGKVLVEHPDAAKGLIRINKDGSYQYKTQIKEKSKAGSFKIGSMTPPKVETDGDVTFENMYGDSDIFALDVDYVWQPFRKYGALGLRLGTGFATVTARGYFKNSNPTGATRSEERYNLFIVPLSAFLEYRFEYVRRQWVVPYIFGGGTYYGLAEIRDDGKAPTFAGAPAAGGGGGLLFSISRLDSAAAFNLSQEYGIADMWLVVEGRAMQGLSDETDFTNQMVSAGIAVDF